MQAYLGTLDGASWALLDPRSPRAGVSLTYLHGKGAKTSRIEFACDPQVGMHTGGKLHVLVYRLTTPVPSLRLCCLVFALPDRMTGAAPFAV